MSAASNYLENKLLDHTLTATTFTAPATRHLALFKNTSGNAATNLEAGTLTDEVLVGAGGTATAYARQTVTFAAAASGTSATNATVTFPAATFDFGTITHVAVMDSGTHGAGNVLFYGAVTTAKTIETGDTFQVSSGNLTVSLA